MNRFKRWVHDWIVTLKHGTFLTRSGRDLLRSAKDGNDPDEWCEVSRPQLGPVSLYPCCWATRGGPHFLSCETVSPTEAQAIIMRAHARAASDQEVERAGRRAAQRYAKTLRWLRGEGSPDDQDK